MSKIFLKIYNYPPCWNLYFIPLSNEKNKQKQTRMQCPWIHIELSGNQRSGFTGLQMPVAIERQQRWQATDAKNI